MTDNEQATHLFLSGADMDPTAIRNAYPGARFVARSRLVAAGDALPPAYGDLDGSEIWGILLTAPFQPVTGAVDVVTDDGRQFQAQLGFGGLLCGSPDDVLAAARYWELPPAYITRLRAAVQALGVAADEEEPRDGN
jgi:hypothetical protein